MANNRRPNMFIIFIMFIITYYNNLIRKNIFITEFISTKNNYIYKF